MCIMAKCNISFYFMIPCNIKCLKPNEENEENNKEKNCSKSVWKEVSSEHF